MLELYGVFFGLYVQEDGKVGLKMVKTDLSFGGGAIV